MLINSPNISGSLTVTGNSVISGSLTVLGNKLELEGSLLVGNISNATVNTDRFLVSDLGVIKYRTGSELLSDIGAAPAVTGGYVTLDTDQTITGIKTFGNNALQVASGGSGSFPTVIRNITVNSLISGGFNHLGFNNLNNIYFSKGSGSFNAGVFAFNNTGTRTYTLPDASGTLALTSDLTGLVTLDTAQTITGLKTFSLDSSFNGVSVGIGGGNISTNTRVGVNSLLNNTTGSTNTAIGYDALLSNISGISNTANGFDALRNNNTGNFNTAIGNAALFSNTTGSTNTAIGGGALLFNTEGSSNTAIGREAGRRLANNTNLTIANNSIFIGRNTKALDNNQTNQIVIGDESVGLGNNTSVLGNNSTVFGRWFGNLLIGDSTNGTEQLQVTGTARFTGALNGTSAVFSGTLQVSNINNGVGDFITTDSNGVLTKRTAAQTLSDIGGQASLTNPVTGTGTAGQVAFWTGSGTQEGSSRFTFIPGIGRIILDRPTGAGIRLLRDGTIFGELSQGGNNDSVRLTSFLTNPLEFRTDNILRWSISSTGIFQSNGTQTIQTSSGILTLNPTGGVNLATVSGNVGIGVTGTPSAKLHVVGDQILQGQILLRENNGPFNVLQIIPATAIDNPNVNRIRALNTTGITLETGGTERFNITSTGNVLIGTTTPNGNTLRVNGVGFFDQGIRTGNPFGSTTDNVLIGRFLIETAIVNGSIRIQIGTKYYNIAAQDLGEVPL